jgi:hypothetical protein
MYCNLRLEVMKSLFLLNLSDHNYFSVLCFIASSTYRKHTRINGFGLHYYLRNLAIFQTIGLPIDKFIIIVVNHYVEPISYANATIK